MPWNGTRLNKGPHTVVADDTPQRLSMATVAAETQRLLRNVGAHIEVLAVLGLRLRTDTVEGRELLQACHKFLQHVWR